MCLCLSCVSIRTRDRAGREERKTLHLSALQLEEQWTATCCCLVLLHCLLVVNRTSVLLLSLSALLVMNGAPPGLYAMMCGSPSEDCDANPVAHHETRHQCVV